MTPLVRSLALRGALVVALMAGAGAVASTYTYDVDLYNRYVSYGPWWRHSSMTNSTASAISWSVTFTSRACTDLSGAVSLAIAARIATQRSKCTSTTQEMTTSIAAQSSASLRYRDVTHYDYYVVRKIDRYSGRVVDSGYATRRDSFNDYGFSPYR